MTTETEAMEACPYCNGRGKIALNMMGSIFADCSNCSGTGRRPMDKAEAMEACPNPWCQSIAHPERGTNRLPVKVRGSGWQVVCPYCGTKGPNHKSREGAIAAWNRRPTVPEGLVEESIAFGNLRDLVSRRQPIRPGTFAYAALIDHLATLSPASHDSRLADELEEAIEVHQGHCVNYVSFDFDLARRILSALRSTPAPDALRTFQLGDRVTKTKGSSWTGRVVGFYSTSLTPEGYAVESENEPGSVQIYPVSALREGSRDD